MECNLTWARHSQLRSKTARLIQMNETNQRPGQADCLFEMVSSRTRDVLKPPVFQKKSRAIERVSACTIES